MLLPLSLCLALSSPQAKPTPGPAAQPVRVVNGGFESALEGWFTPPLDGFVCRPWDDDPREGQRCLRLEWTGPAPADSFGNAIQSIPAKALRGKRVRLRAAVRVEGAARAQLWLREDGREYSRLLDNMDARPIRSTTWGEHDIVADVDERADILVFGLMLFEGGAGLLDDVRVDVLGATDALHAPARELDERSLANLVAFARLFGYVRHFHPSDQAAGVDWERAAAAGLLVVEDARGAAELARRLQDFFAPVAPTVQVFASEAPPPAHPALAVPKEPGTSLVRWHNRGFGLEPEGLYSRKKVREPFEGAPAPAGWSLPGESYEVELVPGVTCRVPTTLFATRAGTVPVTSLPVSSAPAGWGQPPYDYLPSGDDRRTRLADVVLAWNVFQHFYPYFDVVQVDWPAELGRALTSAARDADGQAFLQTLRRMVAALQDGHGFVFHEGTSLGFLGAPWRWVEGELVLVGPALEGALAVGDLVEEIDGVPTQTAFERLPISAAAPGHRRFQALREIGLGPVGSTARLAVRAPSGERRVVEFPRGGGNFAEPRPAPICELEPWYWYVDLERIGDEEWTRALPELVAAEGIVFDVRGYPSTSVLPLMHLTRAPIESEQWLVPIVPRPDRTATTFDRSSWTVRPRPPLLDAKVAFLIDGRAVSWAETFLALVEHGNLGALVGEPTAGTNGNVNPFLLPGGYHVSWTGMRVLKPDGSRHHGVGIHPTVPCVRTRAGVAAGRDEQLERALAVVKGE